MSYEGYDQAICTNGHLFVYDALGYYYREEAPLCFVCGAAPAWSNEVDQTNCEEWGFIDHKVLREKFMIEEEKWEECHCCHHRKIVSPAVFWIPTRAETDPLRTYIPEGIGKPIPVPKE